MKRLIHILALFVAGIASVSCYYPAGKLPSTQNPAEGIKNIKLPPGFIIETYIDGVANARSMTLSPGGVLYVGTRNAGKVYAVRLKAGMKEVFTIAQGLREPNGVAFKDGSLYVAEIHRVLKFENVEASLGKTIPHTVVNDGFPSEASHGWKFMAFGPDGKLYVPVGMPCNICEQQDRRFGTIMRMNADGSGLEVYASGVRNTVGFDWQPGTRALWFTDNGRDWLGDDLPPDELNAAPKQGMNFGFPYCYGKNHPDPEFENKDCSKYEPAALELGPHVAALGMRFYDGKMFPEKYRRCIFIAEHGSWNRSRPIGYRVMAVELRDNKPISYEVFAEGWLSGLSAWGRPVDVQVMPDGSLLVSDDKAGAIYRISYSGK